MRRVYSQLTSDEASTLMQARSGHNALNEHRNRQRIADSPLCECGRGDETVAHILHQCILWDEYRRDLIHEIGPRWNDTSFLLRGWRARLDAKGQPIDGPKDKWKPSMTVIKATLRFLQRTGRFETTRPHTRQPKNRAPR